MSASARRLGSREWWRTARAANRRYREVFGRRPDLIRARRHSERIQRAKLFQRDPRLPALGDKIEAKRLVADLVGEQYVVPTLWFGEGLPPRSERTWPRPFFVKASAGSSMQVRVPDDGPPRWRRVERKVDRWLEESYGAPGAEWHYALMPRRILVEPHLGDHDRLPDDYKLWVFHGQVKIVHWLTDRGTPEFGGRFLDRDWTEAFRSHRFRTHERMPHVPRSWETMVEIAETLAQDFPFVRVDLYEVDGRPMVGELTFTPTAGFHRLDPPEADLMLGAFWRR